MTIACYRPITIKTKKDVEEFLNSFTGMTYLDFPEYDVCIEGHKDGTLVSYRMKSERGNVFSPYIQLMNPIDVIYKNRKYVNEKLMK